MQEFDTVIVGAGVVGCAIAYELSYTLLDHRIAVFERNTSPGMESPGLTSAPAIAKYVVDLWKTA